MVKCAGKRRRRKQRGKSYLFRELLKVSVTVNIIHLQLDKAWGGESGSGGRGTLASYQLATSY